MRHAITIRRQEYTDDGAGGSVQTWRTIYRGRAKVEQLSSGEQYNRQRITSPATHKFVMRYFANLRPSDQIVFNGVEYNISGQPDNWQYRNLWLTIMAASGVVQ